MVQATRSVEINNVQHTSFSEPLEQAGSSGSAHDSTRSTLQSLNPQDTSHQTSLFRRVISRIYGLWSSFVQWVSSFFNKPSKAADTQESADTQAYGKLHLIDNNQKVILPFLDSQNSKRVFCIEIPDSFRFGSSQKEIDVGLFEFFPKEDHDLYNWSETICINGFEIPSGVSFQDIASYFAQTICSEDAFKNLQFIREDGALLFVNQNSYMMYPDRLPQKIPGIYEKTIYFLINLDSRIAITQYSIRYNVFTTTKEEQDKIYQKISNFFKKNITLGDTNPLDI